LPPLREDFSRGLCSGLLDALRAAVGRRLFGRLARYERLEPRYPALQVVRLDVRVTHRGGQVSVSKELLSDARIDARSEESRCEVMAQVMNEAREVREPSAVRDALEKLIEPALALLLSLRIRRDDAVSLEWLACCQFGVKLVQDWHDTLVSALRLVDFAETDSSPHRQRARLEIDVSTSKPADLAGPKAGERREHDRDSMLRALGRREHRAHFSVLVRGENGPPLRRQLRKLWQVGDELPVDLKAKD